MRSLDTFKSQVLRCGHLLRGCRTAGWHALGALSLACTSPSAQAIGWGTEQFKSQLGDYSLHFTPAEVDLVPQRSHRKIGLRLKAQVLNLELSRQVLDEQQWTTTHGLRGRVEGQISSYEEDALSTQVEVFRRWTGVTRQWVSFAPDIDTTYEVSSGLRRDLKWQQDFWVLNASQTFKAPLPASMQWNGLGSKRPVFWRVDFQQAASHRLGGDTRDRNWVEYTLLLALEKDFPFSLMGRPTHLAVMLGPEFSGNREHPFKAQGRLRLRLKF